MSPYEAIERYLEQATVGLKDDPGLRREVSSELASHLEAAIAGFRNEGLAEEESVTAALKGVGSPVDVAGELQAANLSRMKTRARTLLFVRFLLVPLAVLVTLVHTGLLIETTRHTAPLAKMMGHAHFGEAERWIYKLSRLVGGEVHPEAGLTEEQLFILHGDTRREKTSDRVRALWESSPDDVVFLGHYITRLLAETRQGKQAEIDHTMAELQRGMEVEPENARYEFLRAALLLGQAAELETETPGDTRIGRPATRRLVVRDRALLEQAMAELLRGAAKPVYRRYDREMLVRRRSALGLPENVVDQVYQISLAAGLLLPDISRFKSVMEAIPLYADLLRAENRPDETRAVLDAWMPCMEKLLDDEWTLIGVLVMYAVALEAPKVANIYEAVGHPDDAELIRRRGEALAAPVQDWMARKEHLRKEKDPEATSFDIELVRRGSMISRTLFPALGPESYDHVKFLRGGRMLEYVKVDQVALLGFEVVLVLVMAGAILVALRWRFTAGGKAIPLLMLPTIRQLLRALVLGVVLPAVCFVAYTSWSRLGIREFSFLYLMPRPVLELGLLGFTMMTVVLFETRRAVRDRCASLQVPPPEVGAAWRRWLPVVLLGLAWLSLLVSAVDLESRTLASASMVVVGAVLVLFMAAAGWTWVRALVQKRYGLYHGTSARALVPVFAVTVLVCGIAGHHILQWRESHWVRADRLFDSGDLAGFTRPETDLTNRLLSEMRVGLAE